MLAIYKKELRAFFTNMTGWIFIAFILAATGIFASATNFAGRYPSFEISLGSVSFIFLFVVPILTMRSLAEEKRQKTDQLLYSLPIPVSNVVIGKYLAMLTIFAIPCGVMCVYPLILKMYGSASVLTAYSSIFGFMLLGAALISVGLFISSLTESQIIAAVLSFGAMLVLYLINGLASMVPSTAAASYIAFAIVIIAFAFIVYLMIKDYWMSFTIAAVGEIILSVFFFKNKSIFEGAFASMISWFSFYDRLNNFIYGMFDLTSVVFYLTIIAVFLFFSIQSVEKHRWS